jgi:hypothetical protein
MIVNDRNSPPGVYNPGADEVPVEDSSEVYQFFGWYERLLLEYTTPSYVYDYRTTEDSPPMVDRHHTVT